MVKIGIAGVCGKMGKRIASLAAKDPEVEIIGALERSDAPEAGEKLGSIIGAEEVNAAVTTNPASACEGIDCLIDFTLPEPTLEHIEVCKAKKVPMVIGTTGLTEEGEAKIRDASGVIPIVFSPNMAIGVNVLFDIVREASRILGKDFGVKVDETHHVHKKDSPSGTAKMIGKVIKEASDVDADIEAFREGEVIGNHGIIFDGEYETLEIRHDAKSRDVFAAGAIEAAKFVKDKPAGLYNMADVLGLK
ncbi:4-hydroxy-tetrahydrodipicolinate reductase [Candidatus Omnitrophota bacterium]